MMTTVTAKIAVNGRFLSRQITGVERYGRELLRYLAPHVRLIPHDRHPRGARGHIWEQLTLPSQIRGDEILWSPANTGPLTIVRQVLTLHDLSPLDHPEWYAHEYAWWYRFFVPRLVRRVRKVVAPSETTRRNLLCRFSLPPDRVIVVPGGVDRTRFKPDAPRPAGLPARYVLFVGSHQPRKNLGTLLQAWGQIAARYPDVWLLAAGVWQTVFRRETFSFHPDRLRWLGYVPEQDLPGLYAGAEVLVMPSKDEGFGLPLLEAMACGTSVVAARAGAMPEVAGDAALWFDPRRPDELAAVLECCLDDASLRESLVRRGLERAQSYSW